MGFDFSLGHSSTGFLESVCVCVYVYLYDIYTLVHVDVWMCTHIDKCTYIHMCVYRHGNIQSPHVLAHKSQVRTNSTFSDTILIAWLGHGGKMAKAVIMT